MGALATAVRIRHDLHSRLLEARARTDEIFRVVREEAMYDRPIPERHRIIFYVGHVEAFDWNLLAQRAFGLRSFQRTFDHLFAFGIDPVDGGLPSDTAADWPTHEEVERYNRRLREELDRAIEHALERPEEGHPQLITMLEVAIEHRLMHAETLAYMLHRLPSDRKISGADRAGWKAHRVKSHLVEIPAGTATLGLDSVQGDEFGWDNEFGAHEVAVNEMARTQTSDGSAVSSRCIWNARRRIGAQLSLGRRGAGRVQRKLQFQIVGTFAGGLASRGRQRIWCSRSCRQRLGVDEDGIRAVSRIHAHAVLSGLLRKFL